MANRNSPAPDQEDTRKNLQPIFGSHCASQTYALKAYVRGSYHIRLDAYMDDPVKKTWSIQKTATITEPSIGGWIFGGERERTRKEVHKIKSHASFNDVLDEMMKFERQYQRNVDTATLVKPEAEAMGYTHFRAFAEREGYVFDMHGHAHARPHRDVLPAAEAGFLQEDIDRANKHLQRPENEFDNAGPASKAPQTHFLFDQFTRAAHLSSLEDKVAEMRALDILDRFTSQIRHAHDSLQTYCSKYQELGQGGLIDEALDSLRLAGASLRQLKAYGVDCTDFESFVVQCKVASHVLHAQGLYDLMNRGEGDFAQNEALFRRRVDKAVETYRRIDDTDNGIKTLQDMIVQSPHPAVPSAITAYLHQYDSQREAIRQANIAERQNNSDNKKPPYTP